MRRRQVVLSAIMIAVAGTTLALTVPAIAGTSTPPGSAGTFSDASAGIDPDVVAAMQRDLKLSVGEIGTRVRNERQAGRTDTALKAELGSQYGGSWMTDNASELVVGVTTEAAAARVRKAGAQPQLVTNSESELNTIKGALDTSAKKAGKAVTGWYVDVKTSSVVVTAKPGGQAAAEALVAASGMSSGTASGAIKIVTSEETPRLLYDVRGADAYYINSSARCSIGFAVQGGFVSAGHCGNAGNNTAGSNKVSQGTFKSSSFPGNDYSFISVNSNWTPTGVVNDYDGGTVAVYGSEEAAVGASVCRSGSTTGTHCGVIQAKNATVNYAEGSVSGLTRTNVCAEPGDSGGSWMSGNQAQGVTSGGSGNCTSGGTTFFQPVNEILSAYNLTLVTSGSGGTSPSPTPSATSAKPSATSAQPTSPTAGPTSPTTGPTSSPTTGPTPSTPPTSPTPPDCTDLEASADGELTSTNRYKTIPGAGYFRAGSGQHFACLTGSTSTNLDLYLQRWTGRRWMTVAKSTAGALGEDEQLTYTGRAGYYRYRIISVDGTGPYLLTANIP
ncbi:MAG: S1 family peptidase [Micromonosporaceae bacterium]|nr:S1 family peptidase [Micromonosporaceae bacterium]